MINNAPFEQLTGTLSLYLGPASEAKPDVDDAPAGNWALVGPTDGDQEMEHSQSLEYFSDNDHSGKVKAARTEEDTILKATIVGLTLENYAKLMSAVSNVTTVVGPPAIKKLPLKRGFDVTQYALLWRGTGQSPYGNFPAQYYVPLCVVDGSPTVTRAKDGRPGLEVEFHVLEDDSQSAGEEMGWVEAQTA